MKTTNSFSLSHLTDNELLTLASNICEERQRRERERKERRSKWIYSFHSAFMGHPNATYKVLGETVVVSVYDRYTGIHMGATTPCGGDKFELSTGIAVAFAKAMGERIPNYI